MGPLLFWGWGGWLVGCLLAPDRQRGTESHVCVCVCVCVSVRGRSGQVQVQVGKVSQGKVRSGIYKSPSLRFLLFNFLFLLF